jgi:hypothetical protein
MSKLSNKPKTLWTIMHAGSESWMYEDEKGLTVVVSVVDWAGRKITEQVIIKKRTLLAYANKVRK